MNDSKNIKSFRELLVWQKGIALTGELRLEEESQIEPLITLIHELQRMLHSLRGKLITRH